MTERAIRPKTALRLIERAMEQSESVFIWGPPGIGKSELIAQIGKKHNRPVIDMRLLLMDPTDLKGIPYYCPKTNTMRWAPASELPGKDEIDLHNAILFLDELNAAQTLVQGAAYQLVLDRKIGEYKLPDGVSIVAAGNRDVDRGATNKMPNPLKNRFLHLFLEVNFEDWQKWAINEEVHPDVIGFLSHHKQHLFNFDPKSPDVAFATPRSWVKAGKLIADDLDRSDNTTLVSGCVGTGLAIMFSQHRDESQSLPKPDDILSGRVTTLGTKEISAMWSLTISLCYTLKEWVKKAEDDSVEKFTLDDWSQCVDNFFRYMMDNFGTEMIVLGAKTALREYDLPIDHRKLSNFKEFYESYGSYILDD